MEVKLKENINKDYNSENKSIHELISEQALRFPDAIAIKHNHNSLTYQQLEATTNQIADCLNNKKIAQGDVVAVAMDRSIEMAACLLAIMKIGAIYLPIDPNLPAERISYIIQDSAAKKLIISKKYQDAYNMHPDKIIFDDIWADKANYNANFTPVTTHGDDFVYIIYTSGSTGHPKGVAVPHKGLLNLLQFRLHSPGVDNTDNMLGITTMSFDIAEEELYLPLICGATLTIADMEIARDGIALLEIVKKEKITIMQATPYIWQMMLESGWDYILPIKAFCGGESMSNELAEKLLKRCNQLWNMYGPTETTICTTVKRITDSEELITIGKPIDNMQVHILDENLNEVEQGNEGELYISGIGVTKGYINRPELTAEKFVNDKFSSATGQKMYKTGDLGRILNNGEIQFLGRIDNQIKLRGFRIEKEEIEYQLKTQEAIKDALVTVYEDDVKNLRLVAYITLKTPTENNNIDNLINGWKDELKNALPDYMVPSNYEVLAEMPLLPSGKINVKALPKPNIQDSTAPYAAPNTELEKDIVEIWENTIGIKNIGINDNFFDLGGTSIIAVKTKIQIEKVTNKRLSPSILFKYPTIKQLAAVIEDFAEETYKSLVPIQTLGSKIPLYIVHGIGLNVFKFRNISLELGPDQPVYGLQAVNSVEKCESLNTIERIAEFYNSEILNHNPSGPYIIAGYSIGGVIAYEMVKQLKEAGRDVKLLIMFDTAVQIPTHQYKLIRKVYSKAVRQFPKLKFRVLSFVKQPKENVEYLKAFYSNRFTKGVYNKHDTYGLPDYMQETILKLKRAFNKYVIVPQKVKIDLFAGERLYYLDDPKYLGWQKYAENGISVHKLSSNHDTIFDPPHNKEIAGLLQNVLNQANN